MEQLAARGLQKRALQLAVAAVVGSVLLGSRMPAAAQMWCYLLQTSRFLLEAPGVIWGDHVQAP